MATQDLRISRLETLMSQMVENQTAMLRLLNEQSMRQDDHSTRLENLEKLLGQVVGELVEIKGILAAPRGMGFMPETVETA